MVKKTLKYLGIGALTILVVGCSSLGLYRYVEQKKIAESLAIHTADGIDSVEPVMIGGIQQWIEVRGESVKNPVLLFIHGGPGSAFMPVARAFQGPWEKFFTVVQWDQRGAGKTFSTNSKEIQRATINMERMHADTLEMVNYLRSRFQRGKIFVLGHSWGSVLGLHLAHEHPELLFAYVGVGQAIDSKQNEEVLYKETLEEAQRTGNKKAIKELNGIAPYPSAHVTFEQILVVRQWSRALIGPPDGGESSMGLTAIFLAPEYSLQNDIDWMRGQFFSVDLLLPDLAKADLGELGYDYRVPVFFLEGRRDPYTPSTIAKEFFDRINAPQKEFVWFEKSGHFPFLEEASAFIHVMTEKVLPLEAPEAAQKGQLQRP